jgi:hypothetical protein
MLSRFLSSMNHPFLRKLLSVHRTPVAVNRTVRALRRCNDVITPVTGCFILGSAGAVTYLTEESGSRVSMPHLGIGINAEPSPTYELIAAVCTPVA